jgi:hypothetical protein
VRYDEVEHGATKHVLKIAVPRTKFRHVFPMVGDECGTSRKYAPPEGTRIRIKPSLDLSTLGLSPEAMIVARALQHYGAVIGDQSGGPISLRLETRQRRAMDSCGSDCCLPIPWSQYRSIHSS